MSFACVLHFIMSSCAFHFAFMFVSCIRAFSPLSVLHSGAPMSPGVPFYLFSCAGVKRSRIGPRLAKRPWFTTGRPPVKFRVIMSPFDTPMVIRVARNPPFLLQPNTLPKCPRTHLTPLHALGRSITIVWPQTTPHLEPPSSLYLYK